MNLCAVIITSDTKEAIIGDAIKSCVDWVDGVVFIHLSDTSREPDRTLDIAYDLVKRGLVVVNTPLPDPFDISELRNLGLLKAAELGFDWAMQLDTDERMILNGVDVKATLAKVPADVEAVAVMEDFGRYDKPRFFRLPVQGQFKHAIHEEYTSPLKQTLMPKVRFHELEKSPEQLKEYYAAQIKGLRHQIEMDPENVRWHYYLGLILELSGETHEAIAAYEKSLPLANEPGTIAWTAFRIACCQRVLGDYLQAVRSCLTGLLYDPSYAELYWMAGLCHHFMGKPHQAIAWEQSAIAHSWRRSDNAALTRFGFKDVCALFEAPYEVLAEEYKILGDRGKEAWAAGEITRARKDREKFFGQGG